MLWFFWVLERETTILQIATIVQSHQTDHIETLIRALERFFYSDNYSGGGYSTWKWISGVRMECCTLFETCMIAMALHLTLKLLSELPSLCDISFMYWLAKKRLTLENHFAEKEQRNARSIKHY